MITFSNLFVVGAVVCAGAGVLSVLGGGGLWHVAFWTAGTAICIAASSACRGKK